MYYKHYTKGQKLSQTPAKKAYQFAAEIVLKYKRLCCCYKRSYIVWHFEFTFDLAAIGLHEGSLLLQKN